MTFTEFSFDRRIGAGIKFCGYDTPTPIQGKAIPLILHGHDVLGLAQTGTGKTAAFALPILQKLLTTKSSKRGPRVLVLAPTRELAIQINDSFGALARKTGIRSNVVIGGVGMNPQIKAFDRSDVIVACPGRLVRLINRGAVDFKAIDTLVLDEADRMLDMGFLPDIKRVLACLPSKRQNLLFSATMPRSILTFAKRILVNPKKVEINTKSPVSTVKHVFYKTSDKGKGELLDDLLSRGEHQSMLIFTRTKYKAKNLSRKLSKTGYDTTFLQGNMSQNQREKALNGFREGQFSIMVATDIAARGIDCDRITHVINYDMPNTVETYTHRIGRTGRAGRLGCAISLVTQEDASQLRAIKRVMDVSIEQNPFGTPDVSSNKPRKKATASAQRPAKTAGQRRRRKPGRAQRSAA
ncbi:DEAD/DEAH box helicase [Pseudodesulfovibrio sp. zrk46]|uniref:DEAD/DEAH box helicase n=1 Tax=Pseudodesulfovibrio sp. zrk46 TaxID=2725288 RepID=UPI001448F2AE|nr:DEAD/DEAH box helicase [Pseudodesulfovibrio sp. zrk46]QJB57084.1 DEAD/DEAH box helicase [Pseudodesulfovibrio sp. zrk46]